MCDVDLNGILVLRGDFPTKGHRYKVMQEHCTNNYRKNFFVEQSTPSIVDFSSFAGFKLTLNNVNLGILLVFNCTCFNYRRRVS